VAYTRFKAPLDLLVIASPVRQAIDLLDRRKHSSAMILTSNRDIDEWPQVFPDPVIANATIDRIFDRADISLFKGTSYRLKGKIEIKNVSLKIRQK
jgi:DNA replication protein DnaC